MKTTTNLGLKKPEANDFYNIDDQNYNMDLLDSAIHDIQTDTEGHYLRQLDSEISALAWEASPYSNWEYQAEIPFTGCTADYCVDVHFSPAQIAAGIYAPFAETGAGKVTIYAESAPTADIVVPVIELRK